MFQTILLASLACVAPPPPANEALAGHDLKVECRGDISRVMSVKPGMFVATTPGEYRTFSTVIEPRLVPAYDRTRYYALVCAGRADYQSPVIRVIAAYYLPEKNRVTVDVWILDPPPKTVPGNSSSWILVSWPRHSMRTDKKTEWWLDELRHRVRYIPATRMELKEKR